VGAFYLSGTEIYGSGLTNGVAPADCGCAYGTGLFDFNKGIKVKPNYVTNLSAGYTFLAGATTVRPELFVENVFDSHYLLKGAFFSGASVGRPRSIQLRLNVGI
jgi:outer membrane receptor for Fe3+-dicitrate